MPEAPRDVLEDYRAAVTTNPKSVEAHCNLGWGHYGRKQYTEALQAFEAALSLDANWLDAHYGLALAYKGAGSRAEAIAAFEKTAVLAAQDSDAVRGRLLVRLIHGHINALKTGDWDLAKEMYQRVP
jgi:tetratricopeptide (TPR) repeat protein